MLTLANLLCGAAAVVFLTNGTWGGAAAAFWLVVASAAFDFLDGFSARLLHTPSEMGIELDSLADMVSFGLVPAAVFIDLYGSAPQWFEWPETVVAAGAFVPLIITAFSALRLAKFNIDDTQHTEFCGLPTPANALLCTSLGALAATGHITLTREALLLIAAAAAVLLISPVRMFSLKFQGFGWAGNELRYIFLAAAICIIIACPAYSVPSIIVLYIAISAVRWCLSLRKAEGKH